MVSTSAASVLSVGGGTAILNAGAYIDYAVDVGPGGRLDLRGGNLEIFQFGMTMDGELSMSSGIIGAPREEASVSIGGYASLRGGLIQEFVPGRGVSFVGAGLAELSGTDLDPLVELWAQDQSRGRVFGSGFSVDGLAIGPGSLAAASGTLSATLQFGASIENVFRHRGASCGTGTCTGRVLALTPGLDWDQDGWSNAFDNCAEEPNASQTDANSDGVGDACDRAIVVWGDPGTQGCTRPPQNQPFLPVTTDLANGTVVDRSAQPCNCFGIEMPGGPGVVSVRIVHRRPSGTNVEVCENVAPFALGLAPGQPVCSTSLDEDGVHHFMATPFDAPNCAAGTGVAQTSSIRSFTIETPEPGTALMLGFGVSSLEGLGRLRRLRAPRVTNANTYGSVSQLTARRMLETAPHPRRTRGVRKRSNRSILPLFVASVGPMPCRRGSP